MFVLEGSPAVRRGGLSIDRQLGIFLTHQGPGEGNKGRSEAEDRRPGGGRVGVGARPCLQSGQCRGWAGSCDVLEALKNGHQSAVCQTGLAFSFPFTTRFCVTQKKKIFFLTQEIL